MIGRTIVQQLLPCEVRACLCETPPLNRDETRHRKPERKP